MLAEETETPSVRDAAHRATFFRQSGWLMVANVAAGAFMLAVHFFAKHIPRAEYGSVGVLLAMTMVIPALPLQMVFAQQTAAALATNRRGQLASMIHAAWLGTFLVWLAAAVIVFVFQSELVDRWQLSNPTALWAGVLVWLGCIWGPMFWGVLQGEQNFSWLGWSMILSGLGRFFATALIVVVFSGLAAGWLTAVAIGYSLGLVMSLWASRRLWWCRGERTDLGPLLRQVMPLALGFGAWQFLFTADTMFVGAWFSKETTAFYTAAGTLSRGLMWLVLPLAAVMFPKVVHSSARSEKTDLVGVTLTGTGVLAVLGGLGLWLVGPWVVRFVYTAEFVEATSRLIPWYAGAIVPLALANVLTNNLLARSDFRIVPWLMAIAVGYGLALTRFHAELVHVLQTLAVFCTFALVAGVWFTYFSPKSKA